MKKLNIHEAKTHLSEHLARLKPGESLLICKRNTPVAELRALRTATTKKRPIGLAAGRFSVPASFFDPLPDDLVSDFEGSS